MKYLSPKQLGKAIGVSESSLKRWIDDGVIDVVRTAGGHRRIELAEAVRFVRMRGYSVSDPSVLGLSAADERTGRADGDQQAEHFYELLISGKDKDFTSALTRLYLDGHQIGELIDGPIREAMSKLGELWHDNADGIGVEHRATEICMRALGYMHSLIKLPDTNAPLAVGGSPPGDQYIIPSLCVSLVLAEQGWREMNLGANTPWQQLLSIAQREKAALVWVSVTADAGSNVKQEIQRLSEALVDQPCQVIVGGQRLEDELERLSLPNLHSARSMIELQSFSRGLLAAHMALSGSAGSSDSGRTPEA